MKHSGIPLELLPPRARAEAEAQLGTHPIAQVSQIIRQRTKGPNKLEREFGAWLRAHYHVVHEQAVTFLLANGVRYTPDFFVPPQQARGGACVWTPLAFETKGFMRDDANVKIKVAASVHPWCQFWLVKKAKKGAAEPWEMQQILP